MHYQELIQFLKNHYREELKEICKIHKFEILTGEDECGQMHLRPITSKKRGRESDDEDEPEKTIKLIDSKNTPPPTSDEEENLIEMAPEANNYNKGIEEIQILPTPVEPLVTLTNQAKTLANYPLQQSEPQASTSRVTEVQQTKKKGKTEKESIFPEAQNRAPPLTEEELQILNEIETEMQAEEEVNRNFRITFYAEIKNNYRNTLAKLREETKLDPAPSVELTGDLFKITTTNLVQFRAIQKHLKKEKIPFQTLDPIAERPKKYVLRGVPVTTPVEEVITFLHSIGINALSAIFLKDRRTRQPMPLCMVACRPSPSLSKIMDLTDFNFLKITVTEFKPPPVKQCYRCEGYGHHSFTCTLAYRCGRCAECHPTKECQSDTVKCCNCSGDHAATWRGCPANPLNKKKNRRAVPLNVNKRNQNQPPSQNFRQSTNRNPQAFTPAPIPTTNYWAILKQFVADVDENNTNNSELQEVISNGNQSTGNPGRQKPNPQANLSVEQELRNKIVKEYLMEEEKEKLEEKKRPKRPNQNTRKNIANSQKIPGLRPVSEQPKKPSAARQEANSPDNTEERFPESISPLPAQIPRSANQEPANENPSPVDSTPTEMNFFTLFTELSKLCDVQKYLKLFFEIVNIFKTKPFVNALFEVVVRISSYWNQTNGHE